MILDLTTKSLRIVLGEVKTTTDCDITTSWAESQAPHHFQPGNTNIHSNGTTPVTVVAAPSSAGRSRDVHEVRLFNSDTVTHTVTLQLFDGSTAWVIGPGKVSVPANGTFVYTPGAGITVTPGSATGPASGDLSGTYPSPTVAAINGQPLGSTTPTSGNLLIGSGTQWVTHAATGDWTITSAGATTVAKVNGVSYGTSPATNTFPLVTSALTTTYTATSQIPGTTTNDSANAGNIGEYISVTVLVGAAVNLGSNTSADIGTIAPTGGDYDVVASLVYNANASSNITRFTGWTSLTSATQPTRPNNGAMADWIPAASGTFPSGTPTLTVGQQRISLSTTTTIYMSTNVVFTVSTVAAYGFMAARRRR